MKGLVTGTGGKGAQASASTSRGKGAGRRAQGVAQPGEAAEGQAATEGAWTGRSTLGSGPHHLSNARAEAETVRYGHLVHHASCFSHSDL